MAQSDSKRQYEHVMIRDLHLQSKRNYWRFKRMISTVLSFLMLVIGSPLFVLIALCIKIEDPKSPVIYSQMRCGRGCKLFRMYKFRTMVPNADKMLDELATKNEMKGPVFKIHKDPRITKVGRVLRATNLDELPQLWNILRGDMVFVGPRPPLPNEVAKYNEYQLQRLFVTPGLTCYWQISENRNDISFDKWLEMDIRYAVERSIWVDIKILFQTALCVFRRTGC